MKKDEEKQKNLKQGADKKGLKKTGVIKKIKDGLISTIKRTVSRKTKDVALVTPGKSETAEPTKEKFVEQKMMNQLGGPVVMRVDERYVLPLGYGDNKIVLMARDPYWAFAYWEITPEKDAEVRNQIDEKLRQGLKYILRVYDVTDINFNGSNANRYFDIELTSVINNWYLNVGVANRSYCVDIGILTADGRFFMIARSNFITTPSDVISSAVDEEWMVASDDFNEIFRLSGGLQRGSASGDISKLLMKRLQEETSSGSMGSLSSPAGREVRAKDFWLVVDAELIIYGATEPDATVTIQGRPLTLNADGTFSCRFALPDGKQVFPVKAVSVDKTDERIITPTVTRSTTKG